MDVRHFRRCIRPHVTVVLRVVGAQVDLEQRRRYYSTRLWIYFILNSNFIRHHQS